MSRSSLSRLGVSRVRLTAVFTGVALLAAACSTSDGSEGTAETTGDDIASATTVATEPAETANVITGEMLTIAELDPLPRGETNDFGPAPDYPDGPLDPEVAEAIDVFVPALFEAGRVSNADLDIISASGDARLGWILADLLRFFQGADVAGFALEDAFETLTGSEVDGSQPWNSATNQMIAWDIPAPPDYLEVKRSIFTLIEPDWEPLFDDDGDVDWRHVSWGGVLIDDRPLGDPAPCARGCIPALDDPAVTFAPGGDWYPDDAIVFGVVINGEARAYPQNIMQVHEMVNDTLGGRRIAIPYCTLCGSAQAYFTDELTTDEFDVDGFTEPVFRTSGLLIRSNKMMYELGTTSLIDTFLGNATTGPLAEEGVVFNQAGVVTSTWAEWKIAHPDTTIVAQDGGIGRSYPEDPLRGRDDNGPIFPIGDIDPRLPVQEAVLGIETASGTPVAVHVASARQLLLSGSELVIDGITIELSGTGIRAVVDGEDPGAHEAFWFAWSQFEPSTQLWPEDFS